MVMEAVSAEIQLSQTSFQELSSLKRQQEIQMLIKGKRTKRQRQASPLRLTMAGAASSSSSSLATSSPTASNLEEAEDDEDMAHCLILLAQGRCPNIIINRKVNADHDRDRRKTGDNNNMYVYQCKTCDRCFPSFQALGGHRASHKKPKLASPNELDRCHISTNTNLSLQIVSNSIVKSCTNKFHECSICGADFSSGQALGGHMRRHRTTSLMNNSSTRTLVASKSSSTDHGPHLKEMKKERQSGLELDLNLPAPPEESKFVFRNSKEQVIVFSSA